MSEARRRGKPELYKAGVVNEPAGTDTATLRAAYDAAVVAQLAVETRRRNRQWALEAEARERIAVQLKAEFPDLPIANAAELAARKALDAALQAEGEAKLAADPRAGKVLVEWKNNDHNWYNQGRRHWRYPGRRGVLQVMGNGTEFPGNIASYRLPSIGDLFIRLLKKDGTAGLQFERRPDWNSWLPEGEDHPEAAPPEHRK